MYSYLKHNYQKNYLDFKFQFKLKKIQVNLVYYN